MDGVTLQSCKSFHQIGVFFNLPWEKHITVVATSASKKLALGECVLGKIKDLKNPGKLHEISAKKINRTKFLS